MPNRVTALVVVMLAVAGGTRLTAQGDVPRILAALGVREGMVIAEIGAGKGEFSVELAAAVGATGHVFSTELSAASVEAIRTRAQQQGITNLTAVAGAATATNLAPACCDAVVMNDVYHHFSAPSAMNASILQALKPGGKLVVVDFGPPPGTESRDPARRGDDGQHGITPETLERELQEAGFELVSTERYGFRSSLTVARRPVKSGR